MLSYSFAVIMIVPHCRHRETEMIERRKEIEKTALVKMSGGEVYFVH